MYLSNSPSVLFEIFDFSGSLPERYELLFLSKRFSSLFTTDQAYMRYLNLLHVEHGLYSSTVKQADERYKDIFLRLYKRRDLWFCAKEVEDPEEEERKKELPLWR